MRWYAYSIVLCTMLLGACQQRLQAEPAVLLHTDAMIKQQIIDFVLHIVGGTDILLADNVLAEQSEFYVQAQLINDNKGRPLDGRHSLPAYHFTLVKMGAECRLQHLASGSHVVLQSAQCLPLLNSR